MLRSSNLAALLVIIIYTHGSAQLDPVLLEDHIINDLSNSSFYERLIEVNNGDTVLKPEFAYLDELEIHGITYLSDGLKVKGYYVSPKAKGKYPCVIWNRGGNREFGMNRFSTLVYVLAPLAQKGYVVIASQYRGVEGGEGMEEFGGAEVNDILNLPDVLGEIPKTDTSKIGMYGWSRGGMMTYLALTRTDRIKAAAVGGGVSDLEAMIADRPDIGTHVAAELIPDYESNKEAALKARSAINWANKFPKDVPLLIMHGTSDWRVKPDQSMKLAIELEKERVPFRLIMYEGADHGINEFDADVLEQVSNWFDRFLNNDEALPDMEYHGR